MIDNKRYTLIDVNELVTKIAEQKIDKNNAVKKYNNLVNKAEKIAKLRSTEHRQKMLKIFNFLGEIFNGKTEGSGLKILTPNQMLSRLPITLTQKQEIILKNLKTKLDNYYILCTDQKNLQNNYIKIDRHYLKMETIFMKIVKQMNHTDLNWI